MTDNDNTTFSGEAAPSATEANEATGKVTKQRGGRPKKAPPPFVEPIPEGAIVHVELPELNLDDETYMFRAQLRSGDLAHSIQAEGQQIPIIVRRHPTKDGYQIISGFRRATAISSLGWSTVAAIVRDLDDEAAFRASVLENTARRTYSDIDRAHVFKAYKDRGYRSDGVGKMMGLSKRQVDNLLGLLELPKTVQEALGEPDAAFKATHALFLKKMKKHYTKLDYGKWIRAVNDDHLSVAQLTRRINGEYAKKATGAFPGLFNTKSTDLDAGKVHLKPVKIDIASLTDDEKAALKADLDAVLKALGN